MIMKFLLFLTLLFFTSPSFSQTDSTKTEINNICQTINSKNDTSSFTFYDGDTLKDGQAGYRDIFYTYRIEKKSNSIVYINVWHNTETDNLTHEFYFQKENLIKAIITNYSLSPTTTFYLWNNTLIDQEPSAPLFWKAFNQLGYCAYNVVERHLKKPKPK